MRHHFEFEVVPGRVLEKHGPLLPRLALETLVGLHYELDPMRLELLPHIHELWFSKHDSEMRHGSLVSVDGVVIVSTAIGLADLLVASG